MEMNQALTKASVLSEGTRTPGKNAAKSTDEGWEMSATGVLYKVKRATVHEPSFDLSQLPSPIGNVSFSQIERICKLCVLVTQWTVSRLLWTMRVASTWHYIEIHWYGTHRCREPAERVFAHHTWARAGGHRGRDCLLGLAGQLLSKVHHSESSHLQVCDFLCSLLLCGSLLLSISQLATPTLRFLAFWDATALGRAWLEIRFYGYKIVEHKYFETFILILIGISSFTLVRFVF